MNNVRILQAGHLRKCLAALLVLPALLFGACNQDAIFYNISQEVEIREPVIKGTPTNIVEWKGGLYAANFDGLYRYKDPAGGNENPEWNGVSSPEGQIRGLAATTDALYVLTGDGLYMHTEPDAESWTEVTIDEGDADAAAYPSFQKIYGDAERLFVGSGNGTPTRDSDNYAILYTGDGGTTLRHLKSGVRLLSGAAFDGNTHFVSTLQGIYTAVETAGNLAADGPVANAEGTDANQEITGIICLEGTDKTIVAVTRGGTLLEVTGEKYTSLNNEKTRSTGALAVWKKPGDTEPQLLLMGIQGSVTSTSQSYVNGYREIKLEGGKLPANASLQIPGDGVSSVSNRSKYESSLGMLLVNHLFQAPENIDKNMTLFASTHGKEGLWSYRENWNAESD